jgi:phosphate transport system permease protein
MVVFALLMLVGMLGLIVSKGLGHFWPSSLVQIELQSGRQYLGPQTGHEVIPQHGVKTAVLQTRTQLRIGSREVYGLDFRWFDDTTIVRRWTPPLAVAIEREGEGQKYGYIRALHGDSGPIAIDSASAFTRMREECVSAMKAASEIRAHEQAIADLYRPVNGIERLLAAARLPARMAQPGGPAHAGQLQRDLDSTRAAIGPRVDLHHQAIAQLRAANADRHLTFELASGEVQQIEMAEVLRAWQPNHMTTAEKAAHYAAGLWTFLTEAPREANTGGGIFPAIFGTMLMVLLMTLAVVPLGVVAALYLHEYARDNWFVRAVRLAVNNLAGVPSIVFGVFGLGFFIYFVGAGIDRAFYADYLPSPTFGTGGILWASLTLALLTVPVVIVATEEGLAAVPRAYREGSLALGATKFQTIRKIVIPYATPGILTGVILAISRGAGEVAPLMLTGVVPQVSEYPLDHSLPFLHLDRKFMHLGFHIYDVGFQSPNVEAVKPLVYSTTLVLVLLVVLLNAAAIILRNRLHRRAKGSTV